MSASNDGPAKGPSQPEPSQGKKPSALLDLKATEVKSEASKPPVEPASPASEPPRTAASGAGAASSVPPVGSGGGAPAPAASGAKPTDPKPAAGSGKAEATKAGGTGGGGKPGDGGGNGDRTRTPSADAAPSGPRPQRGSAIGSVLTHTVAGLVGGLLALLAADTVGPQIGLTNQSAGKEAADALQKRVSDLEQRVAAARAPDQAGNVTRTLAAAEKRLADLEQTAGRVSQIEAQNVKLAEETRALQDRLATAPAAAEDPRITRLQDQLSALAAAAGTDPERGRIPQLAALSGKIADLETTIANQLGQVRRTLGGEIDQRLAPVAEASEAARAGTQRIDRELAALKSEAARLAERAETGKAADERFEQALRGFEQQFAAIKAGLDGLSTNLATELKGVSRPADVAQVVAPVTQRIGQLEASLKDVVRSEEDRRTSAERIVLSLELANLKRAVERGGPYASELADVQKISGDRLNLAPLAKFKEQGVPTALDLVAELRPVANAILDAENLSADATVVDRLLSGAKSIVRVRKVNADPDDKTPEAVVGRMQEAVESGQLGAVLENAKQLGERGQAAARPWLEKVEARHAVNSAIAAVEQQLKATIGGGGSPAKGVN